MNQYDIVCLTSRSEGFGLAALEGMLAGRVLLVSEDAGIARHIYESGCGVVVKPNAQSIQAGLNYLLKQRSDWRTMGLKGREYALEHLTWEEIARSAIFDYATLMHYRPSQAMNREKQLVEVY